MNLDFIAFDVETATAQRHSICEIGIAVICEGKITDKKSWLIQPPENKYDVFNTYLHGIGPEQTKSKPHFPEVWEEVREYLDRKIVVCHNSAFDMGALRSTLDYYNIKYPTFDIMCTIRLSRKTIPGLSRYTLDSVYKGLFGKDMCHHHRACDDAMACGEILLECLKRNNVASRKDIEDIFCISIGRLTPRVYHNQHATRPFSDIETVKSKGAAKSKLYAKATDVVGDPEKLDPDNYFYEKVVCFTGAFSFISRKELYQYIADIGGTPADRVTNKTDVLVVGQQDFRIVGESGMSSKQRRALELLSSGQDIEILSESDFLSYASESYKPNL